MRARDMARLTRSLFVSDRFALATATVFVVIVLIALLAPLVAPYDPIATSTASLSPPSLHHPFGTDVLGRDILSRIIWGARATLFIPMAGIGLALLASIPLGLVGGFSSRWIGGMVMRSMDILLSFPSLLLALIVITILGSGSAQVAAAIGVANIPLFVRVVYGSTQAAKRQDYVIAARAIGCTSQRIASHHILPNILTPIIVVTSSGVGWAILTATALNFVGFGVKLPDAEWGTDVAAGSAWLQVAWWMSTFPGAAIAITILSANYLGDHIASVLEPRSHWMEQWQEARSYSLRRASE